MWVPVISTGLLFQRGLNCTVNGCLSTLNRVFGKGLGDFHEHLLGGTQMAPQIRLDNSRVEGVCGDTSACMVVQEQMTTCCSNLFDLMFVYAGGPSSRLARERLKRTLASLLWEQAFCLSQIFSLLMSSRLMEPQEWAMEDTVTILAGADLLIRSSNKYVSRKWPKKKRVNLVVIFKCILESISAFFRH